MFQTGRVAAMMSQDLEYKLAGYYRQLQIQYTPQELAHELAVEEAEAEVAAAVSSTVNAADRERKYQEARQSVRDQHYSRFAGSPAPCKFPQCDRPGPA